MLMPLEPVRFVAGEPMLLGGLRRRHPFTTAELGMAEQWRAFSATPELPGRIGAHRYGVVCGADTTSLEYLCAVQVESLAALPEGSGRMRVPAQLYAVFAHQGPAAALRDTWQRAFAWLGGVYESAHQPDFEVYGAGGPGAGTEIELWLGVVRKTR